MRWSKIKNIVIALLLVVDLLLLGQVVLRETESAALRRQAREEAAALLAASGIRVDLEAMPEDRELGPMWCQRDSGKEAALAAALLGEATLGEDGGYAGAKGRVWFYSSGEFTVELDPSAYSLGEESAEELSARVMDKLDFQGEILSVTEENGVVAVRMRQSWEGSPIFSCEAVLTYRDGSLRTIQGKRLPGVPTPVAGDGAMTVTTALIRFLSGVTEGGYVRSQVKSMTVGYEMTAMPPGGAFKLTPVWQVETDASPFWMDAQGNLTQITE